jgi:hypothetical protein
MSENLSDFFKLLAEDKRKKKEEFNSVVGDLGLDTLFNEFATLKKTREERKKQNPNIYKMSYERKKLMSKVHKGKVHPEEWRKRQSQFMKNFTNYSPEFLEMQKGENKRGEKNHMWGTKASEETRRKQSEYHKNNPVRYWLGKKQSPESIEKRRQSKINKTPEQMLETYIKFHISKMGYEPSEEKKQNKLQEYIKKKEN